MVVVFVVFIFFSFSLFTFVKKVKRHLYSSSSDREIHVLYFSYYVLVFYVFIHLTDYYYTYFTNWLCTFLVRWLLKTNKLFEAYQQQLVHKRDCPLFDKIFSKIIRRSRSVAKNRIIVKNKKKISFKDKENNIEYKFYTN